MALLSAKSDDLIYLWLHMPSGPCTCHLCFIFYEVVTMTMLFDDAVWCYIMLYDDVTWWHCIMMICWWWWCCYNTCWSNLDLKHSKYIHYSKLASMFISIKTQGVWVLTICSSNFFFLTNRFRTTTSVFPAILRP